MAKRIKVQAEDVQLPVEKQPSKLDIDDLYAINGIPGEDRRQRRPFLFKHDPEKGHKIYFTEVGGSEPIITTTPLAVRVTPSGGVIDGKSSYVIEIFYEGKLSNFNENFYKSFFNKVLVLQTGVNEKGKPMGKRYHNLHCTFTGMATVPEIDEQRRLVKFACTSDVPLTDIDPVITAPSFFKTAKELARFDSRIKGVDFDRILKK